MRLTRRDLLLAAVAVALSGCTLLLEAGPHDEGLVLAAAERVADGQVPHRDFWWNYGPGQAYLLGGLTALTGPSLLAWRIVRVLIDAVVVVLAARLVDTHAGAGRWATATGLAVAGAMAWPSGPGPGPTALALALAALLTVARRPAAGAARAGTLAGLAALFRPEIGVLALAGVLVLSRTRRPLSSFALPAGLGYGALLVLAPGETLDQLAGFAGIQDLQRLPFPFAVDEAWPDPNKVLEAAFPALLVAATAAAAAWLAVRRGSAARTAWALAPLAAGGLAYLLARTDEFHLVPLAVLVALLAGVAGATDRARPVAVGAAVVLAVVALHGVERQAGRLLHDDDLVALPGPVADGVRADASFARGVRLVRRTVAAVPGPVLVAPPRYDRVRFGAPLVNVLLDRRSPSRYDVVQPGVVTTAAVQREIARDLARTRTPWVVRWVAPEARRAEPNGAGRERGARILDAVIARDYREVARDGEFVVLRRRAGGGAR